MPDDPSNPALAGPARSDPARSDRASASLALYRKYRPATFAEVKGQDQVTGPLRQALRSGRINHAYLFSGPRGCGKTSSARILARSLNCVDGPTPEPCGKCDSCVALASSGPGSIDVIEIDAASHGGVDDARELRERAFYTPVSGRFKIYIIDEAHMVTQQGFNALLKLVEEPPPHLKFIFATTEPDKVIATIRSRTHHYPFRLVPPAVLRGLLEEILDREGVAYEPSVLPLVVRAGAGSVRDSLSVLDQLVAGSDESGLAYDRAVSLLGYTDAGLLDEITDAFAAVNGAAVFRVVDRVVEGGYEPRRFAADMLDRFRDLIVLSAVPDAGQTGLLDASPDRIERMREQAGRFGQAELARAAEIVSTGLDQMRGATSPRLLLELMCAQVLLPGADSGEKALLARLERLERGLPGGGQEAAPPQSPPAGRGGARVPGPDPGHSSPGGPAPGGEGGPAVGGADPAAATPGPPMTAEAVVPDAPVPASTESIRDSWDAILNAVMAERRVAWMMLSNATVVSLDAGYLTLRFAKDGEVKGFANSGHDAVLKRVLSARFNVNVQVRVISATERGAGSDSDSGGRAGQPGYADDPGYAGGPGHAGGPSAAGGPESARDQRGARGSGQRHGAQVTDPIDIPDPGDLAATSRDDTLTGMDLIKRELGGKIIDEIDD